MKIAVDYVIVSKNHDDKAIPFDLMDKNPSYIIMNFDEFIDIANNDGLDTPKKAILINIDGLTEDIYDGLKAYKDIGINIIYFTYNKVLSFLKNEKIIGSNVLNDTTTKKSKPKKDKKNISDIDFFLDNQAFFNSIKIGKDTNNIDLNFELANNSSSIILNSKETFNNYQVIINNIKSGCEDAVNCKIYKVSDNIEEAAATLSNAQHEMFTRYGKMEENDVNHIYKVYNAPLKIFRKVYIIDNLDKLYTSNDFKSVDQLKAAIDSIARLGKNAGIHLIIGVNDLNIINEDLFNNTLTFILTGGKPNKNNIDIIQKNIIKLPDENYENIIIKLYNKEANYTIFNV